jgi:hypothetical protein
VVVKWKSTGSPRLEEWKSRAFCLISGVMYCLLPKFKAAVWEVQWKSRKSGSPVYRIPSSDLPLGRVTCVGSVRGRIEHSPMGQEPNTTVSHVVWHCTGKIQHLCHFNRKQLLWGILQALFFYKIALGRKLNGLYTKCWEPPCLLRLKSFVLYLRNLVSNSLCQQQLEVTIYQNKHENAIISAHTQVSVIVSASLDNKLLYWKGKNRTGRWGIIEHLLGKNWTLRILNITVVFGSQ